MTFDFAKLKTGDLMLFNYKSSGCFGCFTKCIKWGTHSNYSHIGMILRDPTYIKPNLKGLFVWESSWEGHPDPQDGKFKLGVQITPIEEILQAYQGKGHVFIRQLICPPNLFLNEKLLQIHNVVYDKPYDIVPKDWIEAFFKKDSDPQKTDRFWCSALVGYIYTQTGVLDSETDWSILVPNDFSLDGENLKFNGISRLANVEFRIM
tara:strand:- start:9492 stop:10109 length:618 start_codon:yes stop_codon:yes gene_type:complete